MLSFEIFLTRCFCTLALLELELGNTSYRQSFTSYFPKTGRDQLINHALQTEEMIKSFFSTLVLSLVKLNSIATVFPRLRGCVQGSQKLINFLICSSLQNRLMGLLFSRNRFILNEINWTFKLLQLIANAAAFFATLRAFESYDVCAMLSMCE